MSAKSKPKVKKSKTTLDSIRENRGKDLSPQWEGHETWTAEQFRRNYYASMNFYNLATSPKDVKPIVVKWMTNDGFSTLELTKFKRTKDWRCSTTMSSIARCLMRGMPNIREDFNQGRDTRMWLVNKINQIIEDGQNDYLDDETTEKVAAAPAPDRTYEQSLAMCDDIETYIDKFILSPEKWDPKALKIINILKTKNAKAAHAKVIKDYYSKTYNELEELASGNADEELRENYNCYSRKNIRKLIEFYKEINAACDMIMDEAKVARKPRVSKPIVKEKLVEKVKYKKSDDNLKVVSISPMNLIGAKEAWIFDTKTRKLYKYIANEADSNGLSIKGTALIGFDEDKSIGKTLRNPADQLLQFKNAGKIALRTFMDDIKTLGIKASGKINEHQIILKVAT